MTHNTDRFDVQKHIGKAIYCTMTRDMGDTLGECKNTRQEPEQNNKILLPEQILKNEMKAQLLRIRNIKQRINSKFKNKKLTGLYEIILFYFNVKEKKKERREPERNKQFSRKNLIEYGWPSGSGD